MRASDQFSAHRLSHSSESLSSSPKWRVRVSERERPITCKRTLHTLRENKNSLLFLNITEKLPEYQFYSTKTAFYSFRKIGTSRKHFFAIIKKEKQPSTLYKIILDIKENYKLNLFD